MNTGNGDNEVLHNTVCQGFKKHSISYFMLSLFLCKCAKDGKCSVHSACEREETKTHNKHTGAVDVCAPVHGGEEEGIRPVQFAISSLRAPFLHI